MPPCTPRACRCCPHCPPWRVKRNWDGLPLATQPRNRVDVTRLLTSPSDRQASKVPIPAVRQPVSICHPWPVLLPPGCVDRLCAVRPVPTPSRDCSHPHRHWPGVLAPDMRWPVLTGQSWAPAGSVAVPSAAAPAPVFVLRHGRNSDALWKALTLNHHPANTSTTPANVGPRKLHVCSPAVVLELGLRSPSS